MRVASGAAVPVGAVTTLIAMVTVAVRSGGVYRFDPEAICSESIVGVSTDDANQGHT